MTTLSRKMIGYALGRNPLASDRRLIGEMVRAGGEATFADLATARRRPAGSSATARRGADAAARARAVARGRNRRRPQEPRTTHEPSPPSLARPPGVTSCVASASPWRCRGWSRCRCWRRRRRAAAAGAAGKAAAGPPLRLGIVFFSNGVEPAHWWAKGSGASMELGPGLTPMLPHREDMVFIRGPVQPVGARLDESAPRPHEPAVGRAGQPRSRT